MNCNNLYKSLIELWVGNSKKAEEISLECANSLKDEITELRNKVREAKNEAESEYLLPKILREKGLTSQDLLKLAMYELSRRVYTFSGASINKEKSGLEYSWLDLGFKKVLKGYCEDCKGYISIQLDNGFLIMVNEAIYAEFLNVDESKAVETVLDIIKTHRKS